MISLMNIMNKKDELGSPCLTPSCERIGSELFKFIFTADLTDLYIDFIVYSSIVELMSWRIVRCACMHALTFSFKPLLLPNHLANLVETS